MQQNYSSLLGSVSASPSLEAGSAAGRFIHAPPALFPGLHCLLLAAVTSIHRPHCAPGGGTHFSTAKSQGWLSPEAVLHHGCMKKPAGSARAEMGIKPFGWSYFIPNTGESGGYRSRAKCFMIAVSKCSSNQLQLPVNTARRAQFSVVIPGDTHTQMFL